MNALIPVDKPNQLYARMQQAVSACYSLDDCTGIATQADAIAAYFKQIRDDDQVRKFFTIKVRAWRRIGEILLVVDASDCESQSAHVRKIRKHFSGDATVKGMTDAAITNAIKLGKLPADYFEQAVGQNPNTYAILAAYQGLLRQEWEASPEGKRELAQRAEERAAQEKLYAEQAAAQAAKKIAEAEKLAQTKADLQKRLDQQYLDHEALEAARKEVGFTMDRRDRERLKEVVFIIKEPVHDTLRQAAFDRRLTMQAVLRAGLAMWLMANGYPYDPDDMVLHPRGGPSKPPSPSPSPSPSHTGASAA